MKSLFLKSAACVAALAMMDAPFAWASPLSVSDGRTSQRAGTKLVDVYYDLSGGVAPYTVSLQGSLDGGTTWTLPVTTVSGNVGSVSTTGLNRVATWNAGTDWSGQLSANVKFRVNVTDSGLPPVPDGFALIPAGSFQMGDQSSPLVGDATELPVHSVYVSAFYMENYEVSKALWDEVRAWGVNNGYTDLPTGGGKSGNHPVQTISWRSAVKWCNAQSQKEGVTPCYTVSGATYKTGSSLPGCNWMANGYRLPTEAEWEKAARGGLTGLNFPWGNTISQSLANYYSSTSYSYDISLTQGYHPTYFTGSTPYSAPVGSFGANHYGLFDMAGNVKEWCWDWYGSYAAGSQTDPRGSSPGQFKVVRGGGWGDSAFSCRNSYRIDVGYYQASSGLGFRVARSSVP